MIWLQEVFKLYKFALMLQLLVLIPYLLKARHFHYTASQVINKLLLTAIHAASPAVPAVWLLCGFGARDRMKKMGINMVSAHVLKLAASCSVVCFDKTGTLTGAAVRASTHIVIQHP